MAKPTKTVTVECKLSHGLTLRVFEKQEHPFGLPHTFIQRGSAIEIKPGLNPGVDREFFETWLAQNEGTIYAHDNWIAAYGEEE